MMQGVKLDRPVQMQSADLLGCIQPGCRETKLRDEHRPTYCALCNWQPTAPLMIPWARKAGKQTVIAHVST